MDTRCWFCGTDAQTRRAFSYEFDAFYHLWCAWAHGVWKADPDPEYDPVLEHERQRIS